MQSNVDYDHNSAKAIAQSNMNGSSSSRTLKGRWEPPSRVGGTKFTSHDTYSTPSYQPQQDQHQTKNYVNKRQQNGRNKSTKQKRSIEARRVNSSNDNIGNKHPTCTKRVVSPDETKTMPMEADILKLDPENPDHARRIRQRRRQVMFGKNTAGYEEYIKQVPKHKRKFKSMDHPQTPDHLADIPTKRWQGQMNAWRRSLHKFDPPDLASKLAQATSKNITLAPRPCITDQDKVQEEIAQAKASGLQVAFDSMNVGKEAAMFSLKIADNDHGEGGNNGIDTSNNTGDILFDEEAAYQANMTDSGFLEQGCESDSDDDLL